MDETSLKIMGIEVENIMKKFNVEKMFFLPQNIKIVKLNAITLPDGNNLNFSKKVTGQEIAEKISKSLAKQTLIISIDGELKDLDFLIEKTVQ